MIYWGSHLIINARRCNLAKMQSAPNILNFNTNLVHRIKMIPYGKPLLEMFGDGNKKGYTLCQLIMTSNIMAHFAEEDRTIYLDVFSCKDFSSEDVKAVVQEYFEPEEIESLRVSRDSLLPMKLI